jgi:hypothetical protein
MILIAVFALTAFHPGFCFPKLAGSEEPKLVLDEGHSESEVSPHQGVQAEKLPITQP